MLYYKKFFEKNEECFVMAKKYQHRAHVSVRKKQEEEKKLAKRRAFYAKYKKQLTYGSIALVALIVIISVLCYFFAAPAGSLNKVQLGKIPENAIVRNLGNSSSPRYYIFGSMDQPEGYTVRENYSTLSAPEQNFSFTAESEENPIQSVYVTGVKERKGADMAAEVAASSLYTSISEVKTAEIAGHTVNYLFCQGNPKEEEPDLFYSVLVMYVDTVQDSCILVNCSSAYGAETEIPTEEAMMAAAEDVFACLKLP